MILIQFSIFIQFGDITHIGYSLVILLLLVIQFGDITLTGYSLVILLIIEIGETSWRISRMMRSVILVWISALSR